MWVATAHPRYVPYALAELRRLDPGVTDVRRLSGGVFCFATAAASDEFAAAVRAREPIFVRHLHPVAVVVPASDPARVGSAGRELLASAGLTPERAAVQVRLLAAGGAYTGADVRRALGGGSAAPAGPRAPVLSITVAGATAYLGLSTGVDNLSDWPGGEVRFRRGDLVSRAAFKLLEVFHRYGELLPTAGAAVDLGSAPGGWVQVLLARGFAVTAVDPAPLDAALADRPDLTVRRQDARRCRLAAGQCDLLTCDVNWDPLAAARLLARHATALRGGGRAVLTVKLLRGRPWQLLRAVEPVLASAGLATLRRKQLFHNRDEITLVLARSQAGEAAPHIE